MAGRIRVIIAGSEDDVSGALDGLFGNSTRTERPEPGATPVRKTPVPRKASEMDVINTMRRDVLEVRRALIDGKPRGTAVELLDYIVDGLDDWMAES